MIQLEQEEQELIGDIGRKIAILRRQSNMSQEELASKIGISSRQLSKYEIGRNRITVDRLIRIAQILDTRIINFDIAKVLLISDKTFYDGVKDVAYSMVSK